MICERCGDDIHPVWAAHTAADGNDVCAVCCDVCTDESEGQEKPMSGTISATQHWWAHGVTAELDTSGGSPILHVRAAGQMGRLALSGSIADLRAVGEAILAAIDAIEVT